MTNPVMLAWVTDIAATFGMPAEVMLLLFVIVFSLGAAMAIVVQFGKKELFVPVFFCLIVFFAILGAFNWLFLAIPLILLSVIYFYHGGKEE